MRSLGQYPGCRIVSANILEGQFLDYPPSPPGFFHSRGGVYQQPSSVTKDTENRNVLHVVWDSKDESLFDLDWLSRQRYDASQSFSSRITKDLAIGAIDNPDCVPIPALDYQEVMQTDEGLFQALQGIFERGAVLIRQAPKKSDGEDLESTVADLGKHLAGGQLSHGSLYGDVFHVQSMGDANNIAYTNLQLPPHQDLVYYESKPFLQLLHCAHDANKVVGGESVLIDAMSAAEELRNLVPDLFDILCRVNATFLKQREGADMVSLKPHIVIDPANGEVVTVNWSPPFEGPSHISPDLFERYVLAYQAMECMLDSALPEGTTLLPPSLECKLRGYARKYTWEYALQAGDVMVFNNQRMLHARRAFSTREDGQRHLIGCYTDVMETTNRYRLLLRERGGKESGMRNAGNGTRAIYL